MNRDSLCGVSLPVCTWGGAETLTIDEFSQDGFVTAQADIDSVDKLAAEQRNQLMEANKDVLLAKLANLHTYIYIWIYIYIYVNTSIRYHIFFRCRIPSHTPEFLIVAGQSQAYFM